MNPENDHLLKHPHPSKSLHLRDRLLKFWGVFFIIGWLLGFGFNSLAVITNLNAAGFWGDFQDAADFNHDLTTYADFGKIHCPILLSPQETGTITIPLRNHPENKTNLQVKVVVSKGDFQNYRDLKSSLPVVSGKYQDFQWQVTRQDTIERSFILTRIYLMNQDESTPTPARTAACGVFVMDLFGLNGTPMLVLILTVSFLFLIGGCILLYFSDSPLKKSAPRTDYGLYILAGILLIGMIANLFSLWIFAGLIVLLSILLGTVLIPSILRRRR
jgi:hypothetical protein